MRILLLLCTAVLCPFLSHAQFRSVKPQKQVADDANPALNSTPGLSSSVASSNSRSDTLGFEHRDDSKDAINISYVYLDSTKKWRLDSSIDNFDNYFSIPSNYVALGNNGAAARPLIFSTQLSAGFDYGFHAFDIYQYTFEQTRLYNTTKPFTSIGYQLASGKEQMVKVTHTQNLNPDFNVGADYKLITAPGYFVSQNANHKSFRFFGDYSGKKKRYHATLIYLGNNMRNSENGGIQNPGDLLDPNRQDRFTVPVYLGGAAAFNNNPFVTTVLTGNQYKNAGLLFQQSYDFGRRETININDSDVVYKYYPKLRLQYTFKTVQNSFLFNDVNADSAVYSDWYNIRLSSLKDTVSFGEKWQSTTHELNIIQYPNPENLSRYLMAGANYQRIDGSLTAGSVPLSNFSLKGVFRNLTKNKKWDMSLKAQYFLNGYNKGDYDVSAYLFRSFQLYKGNLSLFFNHANKTPAFLYDQRSSFLADQQKIENKENIFHFGGMLNHPFVNLGISNYIIANLPYFSDYYHRKQYTKTIALWQVSASKDIHLAKRWILRTACVFQKTDEQSPVKVPLFFTRNRLAFEGHFFKNLDVSTGIEARYYTAYKAYGYTPVIGQFFLQDSIAVNNLPDVNLFAHFRIRGFSGYLRTENLNTASFRNGGFGWVNNNFAAPWYPTQGFMIRFGIQWWFVN